MNFQRLLALVATLVFSTAGAEDRVLNLYSSRHYATDEALYAGFTSRTGIRIQRIEAGEDALLERLRNEGARSPADVLVTVDAGRLWRAQQMGLLQPVKSATLVERIPGELRHPEGYWFAFSVRVRPIFYARGQVNPEWLRDYEDLANPRLRGQVCIRSSSNMYNLSLMSSMIANVGPARAEEWARGVVANFARDPKGGDTDQLKAVAAGECKVALSNHYYYVRLLRSARPEDRAAAEKLGIVFPNQTGRGTHVNISGAGVLKHAPHREAAIRFLEYLASPEAQAIFAGGNDEFPVAGGVTNNPALAGLGAFRKDSLNVSLLGLNQAAAQQTYDRAGWK